jgi:hypothetical protein
MRGRIRAQFVTHYPTRSQAASRNSTEGLTRRALAVEHMFAMLGPPRRYLRRAAHDRRIKYARVRVPVSTDDWTQGLAYAVGLLATDGCLSGDRKTVVLVSKDRSLLETFLSCVGSQAPIGRDHKALRVQIADVGFYVWLESIGLTRRKSLTLGPLAIPEDLFLHFEVSSTEMATSRRTSRSRIAGGIPHTPTSGFKCGSSRRANGSCTGSVGSCGSRWGSRGGWG